MHLVCVIPARIGSTRLSEKPLRLLAGEPLVRVVARRVVEMELGGPVVVATDDPRVLAAVCPLGIVGLLTGAHHRSGTERVAEAVGRLPAADLILNVQGDEPFLPRDAALGAVDRVLGGDEIGTAAQPLREPATRDPHRVKVTVDGHGRALDFRRDVTGAWDLTGHAILHHLGVYAYRPATLRRWVELPAGGREQEEGLEQLRPLTHAMTIGVAALAQPVPHGIDTERDLRLAEALL